MDNFTKEELELIIDSIFISLKNLPCPIELEYLKEKIQSMIDNHCENENKEGKKCWSWTTKNPVLNIGFTELWGEFCVKDIHLEETTFEPEYKDLYFATMRQAIHVMVARIQELSND